MHVIYLALDHVEQQVILRGIMRYFLTQILLYKQFLHELEASTCLHSTGSLHWLNDQYLGKRRVSYWIPRHAGIRGNYRADNAAISGISA